MKKNIASKLKFICYKVGYYIQASRYEGGLVAIIFLLLGEWYSFQSFHLIYTMLAMLSILLIVNSGSWINYVFDRELDKHAEKNIEFFRFISPKEMLFSSFLSAGLGLLLLFYIDVYLAIIGLSLFLVFFIYATPPLRLKTIPPLDILANALGFGAIPFLLGYVLLGNPLTNQSIVQIVIVSLLVASYYLFISYFDIETDREFGIKTTCSILGQRKTIYVGTILFVLSFILSIYYFAWNDVILVSITICLPILILVNLFRKITLIRKLVSALFLIWCNSVSFNLFIKTYSIIPLTLFLVFILISITVVHIYLKEEN